jgi:hypothetical protein
VTELSRPDSLLALRARFPYVEQVAYLNTAGASPSSIDVAAAAQAFHSTVKFKGIDGRPAWREKIATMQARLGAYLNAPAGRRCP